MGGKELRPIEWQDFPLPLIQVNPPDLELTNEFIMKAYQNGVFSNSGEIQRQASKALAANVNVNQEGYLTNSNTSGLTACLISIGVRGKHVVISNFTFAATLDAVILAGGIPVLCDIDPDSLTMSLEALAMLLRDESLDVAVVMPTRVLGFVSDFSDLIDLAEQYEVRTVIDSAASFPVNPNAWEFRRTATYEVFSLHATKVFGIGEGGLVVGNSSEIEKIRQTSNFGLFQDGTNRFQDGFNAKADEFVAARALARLPHYAKDVELRREFIEIYKNVCSDFSDFSTLPENELTIYSYFPLICKDEDTVLKLQTKLSTHLTTRRYYFPSISEGYVGASKFVLPNNLGNSHSLSKRIICLPVYVNCTNEVKIKIGELLRLALEGLE